MNISKIRINEQLGWIKGLPRVISLFIRSSSSGINRFSIVLYPHWPASTVFINLFPQNSSLFLPICIPSPSFFLSSSNFLFVSPFSLWIIQHGRSFESCLPCPLPRYNPSPFARRVHACIVTPPDGSRFLWTMSIGPGLIIATFREGISIVTAEDLRDRGKLVRWLSRDNLVNRTFESIHKYGCYLLIRTPRFALYLPIDSIFSDSSFPLSLYTRNTCTHTHIYIYL